MTKRTRSGRMKFMRYDCDRCGCDDAQEFEHDPQMINWFGFCASCHEEMDREAEANNKTFPEHWDLDNWEKKNGRV